MNFDFLKNNLGFLGEKREFFVNFKGENCENSRNFCDFNEKFGLCGNFNGETKRENFYDFNAEKIREFHRKISIYEQLFLHYKKIHNISKTQSLEYEILDSLKILDFCDFSCVENVVDVGSGAGFPAVFLALILGAKFTLFEPNAKKAAFLMLVKNELGLQNVAVIKGKIELCKDKHPAKLITSRALMKMREFFTLCDGFYDENTLFLLYKGSKICEELENAGFESYESLQNESKKDGFKNCEKGVFKGENAIKKGEITFKSSKNSQNCVNLKLFENKNGTKCQVFAYKKRNYALIKNLSL